MNNRYLSGILFYLIISFFEGCSPSAKSGENSNVDSLAADVRPDSLSIHTSAVYLEVLKPSEGMTPIRSEDGWGFMSKDSTVLIKCQYAGVGPFKNGRALVSVRNEDWRKSYRFIDKQNNDLGLFFAVTTFDTCETATIIKSAQDGEQYSADIVKRCPEGIISYENLGWEWSSSAKFLPNLSIEEAIKTEDEFNVLENFDGESKKFVDGTYTFTIDVQKNKADVFTKITVDKASDTDGTNIQLELVDGGVMVTRSFGM